MTRGKRQELSAPMTTDRPTPAAQRAILDALDTVCVSDALTLLTGLPAESVDLIFTDPPYPKAYLSCYGDLAAGAAQCLKPGGFVLAMAGGAYTPEILTLMGEYLNYFWTFHVWLTDGGRVYPRGIMMPLTTHLKPIHAFMKGRGKPRTVVHDVIDGDGNDKRFHHWGQDMKSARYYIDCFTHPGDLVVDPFCGGGSYPLVAQALGRHYIAGDIDPAAVHTTRTRLADPNYTPKTSAGQLPLFAGVAR
jgi:hypothetical protein